MVFWTVWQKNVGLEVPEFDLIDKYLKPLATDQAALGLLDDAAVINASQGHSLVLSKDMMVEGVHYDAHTPVNLLAKKLLRVNLSDLAAMGAKPRGYLLGLSLPKKFSKEQSEQWLSSFCDGLRQDQELFGVSLLGGDTVSVQDGVVLSLTMVGEVLLGQVIKRTGAKAGDVILVTGSLGDAALALNLNTHKWQLEDKEKQYLFERLNLPQPRLEVGLLLRGLVNSAIDVSDGLLADLEHITKASGVGADVYLHKLPLSSAARECCASEANLMENFWPLIYAGGDDYELVFTVAKHNLAEVKAVLEKIDVAVSEIGIVKEGDGVNLLDAENNKITLAKKGYEHFAS